MLKAWREWRGRVKLFAPAWQPCGYLSTTLTPNYLGPVTDEDRPALAPYDGLAEVWDDYAAVTAWDYPPILSALARARGLAVRAALDLACGTGLLTARLAGRAPHVVGLDGSDRMLARARGRCATLPGVELASGDFRDFRLGRRFDLAVCASNSLNYATGDGDLARVFRCVAAHLAPGGLFVFDTTTDAGFKLLAGVFYHVEVRRQRFVMTYTYDPVRRHGTAEVHLPGGVESHRRVPIDPADVRTAVPGTGLVMEDYFYWPGPFHRREVGPQCFFVLKRTDEGGPELAAHQ